MSHASWIRIARNAWAVQYSALVLIVLTFVLSTLSRPHAGTPSLSPDANRVQHPLGALQYEELFLPGEAKPLDAQLEALAYVLNQHDLNAEIRVYLDASDRSSEALSVARAIALTRGLIAHHVPAKAFSVLATFQYSQFQARLDWTEHVAQIGSAAL